MRRMLLALARVDVRSITNNDRQCKFRKDFSKKGTENKKVRKTPRKGKEYLLNPIRSEGGGGFKSPPLRFFALTHLILELPYCALETFPKK